MSANKQLQYIASTIEHVTNQYCQSDFYLFLSHYSLATTTGIQNELGSVFRLGVRI